MGYGFDMPCIEEVLGGTVQARDVFGENQRLEGVNYRLRSKLL